MWKSELKNYFVTYDGECLERPKQLPTVDEIPSLHDYVDARLIANPRGFIHTEIS